VNRGFSGYNSRWFLLSLPSILDSLSGGPPPALYTVMLGGNDCALPAVSNRQAVPLDDFKANIHSIVKQIQAWHQQQRARHSGPGEACRIVLMATPPVADSKWLAHEAGMKAKSKGPSDPSRLNTVTGQYAAAMIEVAVELGLPYVDNWNSLQQQAKADGAGLDDILSDGLHLAPAGQEMLYNALLSTVKVSFPDLFVDPAMTKEKFGLKPLLPWHDAFSRDSPGDAL
jgi:lysophospholipase L1-like esterase